MTCDLHDVPVSTEVVARLNSPPSALPCHGIIFTGTGKPTPALVLPGWRRSVSDLPSSPPATVLEKIMVANVLLALIALIVWFFGFAGSSLPA